MKALNVAAVCLGLVATAALADNAQPVVELVDATDFVKDATTVSYIIFDPDDSLTEGQLTYGLYFYPDNMLSSVQDIRTFATLIADHNDVLHSSGTGDFQESRSADDVQTYTWGDTNPTLMQTFGFAPTSKVFPGDFYLYLVADDGTNEPAFAVSSFTVAVQHPAPTAVTAQSWGAVKQSAR